MEGGGGIPIEPRGLLSPWQTELSGFSDRLARNWREHRHLAFATIAAGRRLIEEGCDLVAGSTIIAPIGEVASKALSQDDELVEVRSRSGEELQGLDSSISRNIDGPRIIGLYSIERALCRWASS